MALRTFTNANGTDIWSDEQNWADNTKPVDGDEVVIADGVRCTIDEDTPNLAKIGTDGITGTGRCRFSADVTVKFADMEAGASPQYQGFFSLTTANTITLDGTVKGSSNSAAIGRIGCRNNHASGIINITGDSIGGSGDDARGSHNDSDGTINITGDSIGGSGDDSYGCRNYTSGTINIHKDSIGGSGKNAIGAFQLGFGNTIGYIHIHGKTRGGNTEGVTDAYGCYIHADSRGRVYFYDDLEDKVAVAVVNAAETNAYCFLGYGKKWLASDGTTEKSEDWLITAETTNAADLQMIETAGLMAGIFVQTDDIDMDEAPYNEGDGFAPIGTSANPFRGTYDGQHYKIENLYINRPATNRVGLFGRMQNSGSLVKNTRLRNIDVTGNQMVGGLFGQILDTIECVVDCSVSGGEVKSNDFSAAGFAGLVSGVVKNCWANVKAECVGGHKVQVGGFAGVTEQTADLQDCFALGDVGAADNSIVGGFAGRIQNDGTTWPTIERCYSAGQVTGDKAVGGFVGNCSDMGWFPDWDNIVDLDPDNVEYCYWDTEASGQAESSGQDDGVIEGLTTAEMKDPAEYHESWDFDDVWVQRDYWNDEYPYLRSHLTDADLPEKASAPTPAHNETDVGLTGVEGQLDLEWQAGDRTDAYNIYKGMTAGDLGLVEEGVEALEQSVELDFDTEYFWRIDSINPAGTTTGDVWSFTTEPIDAHLPEKATTPTPTHEATDVELHPDNELTLEWTAGDRTGTFNLYVDGDLEESGIDVAMTEHIISLMYGTEYNWRVDSVNEYGITEGDVWSFEVKPALSMGPITYEWTTDTTLVLTAGTVTGSVGDVTYTWHEYVDGSWTQRLTGVDETQLVLASRDQEENYRFRLAVTDEGLGNESVQRTIRVGPVVHESLAVGTDHSLALNTDRSLALNTQRSLVLE